MNRKLALVMLLVWIASCASGAGLKEIYKSGNIWFDGGQLIRQIGSRVSILDLKTSRSIFNADLGVDGLTQGLRLIRVLGDSVVYTTKEEGNNYFLNAYSLSEKRKLWRFNTAPLVNLQPKALMGDSVYAISQDTVFKMSTAGELLARRDVLRPHSVRATSQHIYFCSQHELYRLDAETMTRGWRSYCDPTDWYMSADGPIVYSSLLWHSVARIAPDGNPVWISRGPPGFADYIWTRFDSAQSGKFLAFGARWQWSPPKIKMLSNYLFLYSVKGNILWKKPMNAWATVIFGRHVAVLRYRGQSQSPEDIYLEVRRLSDGHLEWESKPVEFHGLEAGGEYFLAQGRKEAVVYRFAN